LKLDEEYVEMIYQEDLEEGLPEIKENDSIIASTEENSTEENSIGEAPLIEEAAVEQVNDEEGKETMSEVSESSPPSEATKKIKVGGFFGKEIEIKMKNGATPAPVSKTPEKSVSITTLKPPRKKRESTIRLCKICGTTLHKTNNCPMCGAKVD
jgi:hypothetical protein